VGLCDAPGRSRREGGGAQLIDRRPEAEGPNLLREAAPVTRVAVLARQFQGLIPWVLIGAVGISLAVGDRLEALAIAAIVVLNTAAGYLQEWRAEASLQALRTLTAPTARVERDGRAVVIPAARVAPGDVLRIEAGDVVAADARLLEGAGVQANESILTGESLPVSKQAAPDAAPGAAACEAPDRGSMLYAGTAVTRGQGRALVTAVGMQTELGRIAGLMESAGGEKTPLQRRLDRVARRLVLLCAGIVAVLFALGVARGEPIVAMLVSALSLAVAAIPEGLPTVVTLALAIGVQRMAERHALVRRLAAVETLGAAQVICSDKTGTLTRGILAVRRRWLPAGDTPLGRERMLFAAAGCCDAVIEDTPHGRTISGDPTEGAILLDAAEAGITREAIESEMPRLQVHPFDPERKRMSIVRRTPEGPVSFVKGAPESVLPRCSRIANDGAGAPLDEPGRHRVVEATQAMADAALRVLAVAIRSLPQADGGVDAHADRLGDAEENLTLLGLVGLADAPRPEARGAVARCAAAGIRVVMITGDHPQTAAAVAREIGIVNGAGGAPGAVLDGAALDRLDDAALQTAVARTAVYARVTPAHKLRIVRAFRRAGSIVAMTGDGVNDAPAVREASVGIAMGRSGTEVTRQAADIVITDDNFATIVNAVEEGRRIFDNIQRTLLYLLAGNSGEILVMLAAIILGWPVPLLPVHILWVNFVTDGFPALALATEKVDPEALRRPPRPADAEFADPLFLRTLVLAGTLIGSVALAGFWIGSGGGADTEGGRSLAFGVLVMSHLTWAFAARSRERTFFSLGVTSNLRLLVVVAATLALQIGLLSVPQAARLFGLPAFAAHDWLQAAALSLVPVTVIELTKLISAKSGPVP
jgi:Ca2+-transporting ATPase